MINQTCLKTADVLQLSQVVNPELTHHTEAPKALSVRIRITPVRKQARVVSVQDVINFMLVEKLVDESWRQVVWNTCATTRDDDRECERLGYPVRCNEEYR